MKEMTWTREEALKRLAIMLQSTENAMHDTALEAVEVHSEDRAMKLFQEAREYKALAIGIYAAADALGISLDELRELEVDADEADQFISEKADGLDKQKKAELKKRVKVVGVDDMPDELKEILKSALD